MQEPDVTNSNTTQSNAEVLIASPELIESADGSNRRSHSLMIRSLAAAALLLGSTAYGALLWKPELALNLPFIPDTNSVSDLPMYEGSCSSCCAAAQCDSGLTENLAVVDSASGQCPCSEGAMNAGLTTTSSECQSCSASDESACHCTSENCTSENSDMEANLEEQREILVEADATVTTDAASATANSTTEVQ